MSIDAMPRLFAGLVDDAAVFPPGSAPLPDAVVAHRAHRSAWHGPMIGPLMVPATMVSGDLPHPLLPTDQAPELGLIGDDGIDRLSAVTMRLRSAGLRVRQIEAPVGQRGQDPLPGLDRLAAVAAEHPQTLVFAEIPMTFGLLGALDDVARVRTDGVLLAPKFRTGGLEAQLFPTPSDLARVIVACRDRDLPFKLTAGLHRAIRYSDPETGFVHHGFVNILVASLVAADGASPVAVEKALASTDPVALAERVRAELARHRPLWTGFGSCNVQEPVEDLTALGLLP